MQDYHDLLVYKRGFEFVTSVYQISSAFPKHELFGLTSQLRRAAVSIIGNIAEGRGKPTDKDFLKFLYTSKGSLNECQCYLELRLSLGYLPREQYDVIMKKLNEVGYLLQKFIKSIQ